MKKIYLNEQTKQYTFNEKEGDTLHKNVIPPRFSPLDKFGKYRRAAKTDELEKKFAEKKMRAQQEK